MQGTTEHRKNSGDEVFKLGAILLLFLSGIMVVLWFLNHATISYYTLCISYWILDLPILRIFPITVAAKNEISAMLVAPDIVTFSMLWEVWNWVGRFCLVIPLLIFLGVFFASLKHRKNHICRAITVDTLPHIMSKHAPAIIPVLYYGDLLNNNVEGQESRYSPAELAEEHNLIINGKLQEIKTKRVFEKQLGRKIHCIEDLAPHELALFAIFSIRIFGVAKDAPQSQKLLDKLNYSCHPGQGVPDFTVIDKEVELWSNHPEAKQLIKFFNYPCTLLMYMHQQACSRGRLASSHFRWLKPIDRPLWYSLNTSGRKTPCCESIAQYQMMKWQLWAKNEGRILHTSYLDDVITAFRLALEEEGLLSIPIPDITKTNEK
ncbi:hypothetical protein ABLA30_01285 [Xenorhabdus nematophila]|uniref:secretion/conjugation apparatus DotM-related subunit n=1 Tax=Xenorhabdus nematophila TaxID=628 RepID=UPI0032B791ED